MSGVYGPTYAPAFFMFSNERVVNFPFIPIYITNRYDSILNGECHLVMENFSKDEVQFTVEFYDRYDKEMFELMNEYGPYTVTLQGKSEKTVWIETKMDVSNLEEVIAHGSASGFNIIIKSGETSRYLGG